MDRNLYQQCSGAHVFRRMSCLITVFCVLLFLCVRVPVCVTISRLPCTYIYKRIVDAWMYMCVYVFSLPSNVKCGPFVLFHGCYTANGIGGWNCIEAKRSTAEDSAKLIKVEVIFPSEVYPIQCAIHRKRKILSLPFPFLRHVTSLHAIVLCICML